MTGAEPASDVPQFQGKRPPRKRKAKAAEGPGLPEPGTMRPTLPPADDGTTAAREPAPPRDARQNEG